jgi:hypothetical protein
MADKNGCVYGLTVLSPIIESAANERVHSNAIRSYLAEMPRDHSSPFAKLSSTHLAKLAVLDDTACSGIPGFSEKLPDEYLVFESNFDGDLDAYLVRMAKEVPEFVDSVWRHCVGYPGVADVSAFIAYMRRCKIESAFFYAHVNQHTVQSTLRALHTQKAVADFVLNNQAKPAAELQKSFAGLVARLRRLPDRPAPFEGLDDGADTSRADRQMRSRYE